MLSMIGAGFASVFTVKAILFIFAGVILGIIFGAIPGLNTSMAVALCLPITYSLDMVSAIAMIMGLFIGGVSGGLISAILLNIPGTAASIATTFDGFPMLRKGQAGKALGIGIVFSFIGGFFSMLALVFIAPVLSEFAIKFSSIEYFAIALFCLTLMATLSGKSMVKGLMSGMMGVCIAMVGLSPIDITERFTYGSIQLQSGFNMIAVLTGAFAVSEIMKSAKESMTHTITKNDIANFKIKGFGFTLKEFFPISLQSCKPERQRQKMRNKFATALRSKSNPQNTVSCTELLKSGAFTYQVHWTFFNWPAEYAGYQVCGVCCDSTYIYATTRCDECPIAVFDMHGNFIKSLGCGISKGRVHGIWKDTAGHILFADDGKHVIRCLAPDGTLEKTLGTFGVPSDTGFDESISGHLSYRTVTHRGEPFNKPTRMTQSQNGCYYVSDGYGNATVHKFDKDFQLLSSWGQPGAEPGQFSIVHSLITDENNRVFVADRDNDRVQVFDENGVFLTSIDDLLYPCDVAVDKDHLYVSENDGRISIFNKQLNLLAQIGHSGSGLRGHSITVDKDGNLYLGMLHGNYNLIKLELIQCNTL